MNAIAPIVTLMCQHPKKDGKKEGGRGFSPHLIDRVPEELWREVQEAGIKTIPKEKKCKKGKMAV